MVAVSKYEGAAQAFLKEHPIGSVVTVDRMFNWASTYADGLASDLLIEDPTKRFTALRRHLNEGGASRNLAEEGRFVLVVEDIKRKTSVVRSLTEHVSEQAGMALEKAVSGAITPIKRSQRALDDIKVEELPEEQRQEIEQQIHELVESAVPIRKVLSEQLTNHYVGKLITKGYNEQQARDMIAMAPTLTRAAKLLKYTS